MSAGPVASGTLSLDCEGAASHSAAPENPESPPGGEGEGEGGELRSGRQVVRLAGHNKL